MTDIEELKERAELLAAIDEMEAETDWTQLEELKERAELLHSIKEAGETA